MALKLIRIDGEVTAELINRFQQNVATALSEGLTTGPTQVTINKNYTVQATDDCVFADSSPGPIIISLPGTGIRTVAIKNISASANAVTVQASKANKIDGTQSSILIPPNTTKSFRYDTQNKKWRQL